MSLIALLGLRRAARREAEKDVAATVAVRTRAQSTRAGIVGRLAGDPGLLDSAGDPRYVLARRAGQLADLSRAEDAIVAALAAEEQQQAIAAQARMRLKAVERLQERRQAEQRALRERAEAAELDDVVAALRHHRHEAGSSDGTTGSHQSDGSGS